MAAESARKFEALEAQAAILLDVFRQGGYEQVAPSIIQPADVLLDRIEESLEAGRRIYLHCWGGIGRTGTTVGCYLVRQGKTADEALEQLSAWWRSVPKSQHHPHSPETTEQVDFIRTWAQYGKRGNT